MKIFTSAKRLPVCVSLALLLIAAGWTPAADRLPDCHVLSAGVDNYPVGKKLSGCLNDARDTTAAFRAQQGVLFGNVNARTLLDRQATTANITDHFQSFSRIGSAGDIMVLFLSGHGGRHDGNRSWYFLPHDHDPRDIAGTSISDRQILEGADVLVRQGKIVVLIVDACFSGQLNIAAQPFLEQYRDSKAGGLVLMLSSGAEQTSAALGPYSAFAKAVAESMAGRADLNRDGTITLAEIGRFSYDRTYELLRQKGHSDKQDSEVAWSSSISTDMPFARVQQLADSRPANRPSEQLQATKKPRSARTSVQPRLTNPDPTPAMTLSQATTWVGNESLSGFGKLSFVTHPDGRAVMTDANGVNEGAWTQKGDVITLKFAGGRIVYTGNLSEGSLSGAARNGRSNWSWTVRSVQSPSRPTETFADAYN